MSKKKTTKNTDEDSREEQAEKVERDAEMMRIRISVNVNGHRAGDPITVARDNEFYGGLVRQGLATEVKS